MTTVRYFAAAAEAAGTPEERRSATSVAELVAGATAAHPALGPVIGRCALLVNGQRVDDPAHALDDGDTVDVLPPFAGG